MKNHYIGLMSGTSMDAVDAVLVDFSESFPRLIASLNMPIPVELKQNLLSLCEPSDNEIARMGEADVAVGELFAQAVNQLLIEAGVAPDQVSAIGSHGQTIRHMPQSRYTLQIGDPNIIASQTGITVVADFRRKDLALGGQGAPLTPTFHADFFKSKKTPRVVLNIGGMANITYLEPDDTKVVGFDTGPGNVLLDAWRAKTFQEPLDNNGQWAEGGTVIPLLLEALLADPYFSRPAPKSTGREYFNLSWLAGFIDPAYGAQDVQATLAELTAISIARAIKQVTQKEGELLICGGGSHNKDLVNRLSRALTHWKIAKTSDYGIDIDWLEAIAFAWFAKQTLGKKTSNIPEVTGAANSAILGGIFYA